MKRLGLWVKAVVGVISRSAERIFETLLTKTACLFLSGILFYYWFIINYCCPKSILHCYLLNIKYFCDYKLISCWKYFTASELGTKKVEAVKLNPSRTFAATLRAAWDDGKRAYAALFASNELSPKGGRTPGTSPPPTSAK